MEEQKRLKVRGRSTVDELRKKRKKTGWRSTKEKTKKERISR